MANDNSYNIWILEQVRLCGFWFWEFGGIQHVDASWILTDFVEGGLINA